MATAGSSSPTVSFNVGGRVYEVSQSWFQSFPADSFFKNKASEESVSSNKTIFIDRDPDRFSLVLDYMRDGKVFLPANVSKGAILQEMKHYGIKDVDEASIREPNRDKMAAAGAIQLVHEKRCEIRGSESEIQELERKIRELEKSKRMKACALNVFLYWQQSAETAEIQFPTATQGNDVSTLAYNELKDATNLMSRDFEKRILQILLNECLSIYGLRCTITNQNVLRFKVNQAK